MWGNFIEIECMLFQWLDVQVEQERKRSCAKDLTICNKPQSSFWRKTALFRCQLHISSTFASWTHALGWQPGIRWTFPSQNKTSGNCIFSIKSSNISLPGSTAKYSCGPYGYFRSPSGEVYYRLVAYWCMTSRQTSDWYDLDFDKIEFNIIVKCSVLSLSASGTRAGLRIDWTPVSPRPAKSLRWKKTIKNEKTIKVVFLHRFLQKRAG